MEFKMKRLLLSVAMALTLPLPAISFDAASMTLSERKAFREEIRQYLIEHPEIIVEAMDALKEREAAAAILASAELVRAMSDEIFEDGHSWIGGNPDGSISLVEFIDYRCGYCRRFSTVIDDLLEFDTDIRFVVKEFPILGEQSANASRFAIATLQIAGDEAYKSVHDALYAFNGEINEATLRRLSDTLGLDTDKIIAHMNTSEVNSVIKANHELASELSINGTPAIILEESIVPGFLSLEELLHLVEMKRES